MRTIPWRAREQALHWITGTHEDLDAAPPLASALAGAVGGGLYGLTATPLANFLREGEPTAAVLTRGLGTTLARDVGGFALYCPGPARAFQRPSRSPQ